VIYKEAVSHQGTSILSYPGQMFLIIHITNLTFVLCQNEKSDILHKLVSKSCRSDEEILLCGWTCI